MGTISEKARHEAEDRGWQLHEVTEAPPAEGLKH